MSAPVVVYVLHRYPLLSQTFVRNEISALRRDGVDVRVFTMKAPDPAVVDLAWGGEFGRLPEVGKVTAVKNLLWWGARHPRRTCSYVLGARRAPDLPPGLAWRQLPALARALAYQRVVACHTHFAWAPVAAVSLLAVLLGARSSATVHARDIYLPRPQAAAWMAGLDRLVTVCRYNVERMRRDGLWDGPVDVVPCGVDVPGSIPPVDVRSHRVVTVGRLVPKKGMLTLVAAFARVVEQVPDATLDIIGDGPMRPRLEAVVAEHGLGDRVRLLGARTHDASLAAIDAASVFALACEVDAEGDSDALPVVVREAMVRARPVVTTAVAGIPEVVDDASGWVVAPGDSAALAQALTEALTDGDAARCRGLVARERTEASGTLAETAAGMRAVLGLEPVTAP